MIYAICVIKHVRKKIQRILQILISIIRLRNEFKEIIQLKFLFILL